MGFGHEVRGRVRAVSVAAACRSALPWVAVILLIAAVGCGTKHAKGRSAETQGGGDSSATASAGLKSDAGAGSAHHQAGQPAPTNHVRLTAHGCIQFEPHWSDIHIGQSLVLVSELKSPVTIHVSPGAFDKSEYMVRPGATLTTGPARAEGSYSMWSEPAACQGAPVGAHGSGPGVTVEAAAPR
jgi:hypothetical protein